MKKIYLSVLFTCFCFAGCKSISFNELMIEQHPNKVLLPALDIQVSRENMKGIYSSSLRKTHREDFSGAYTKTTSNQRDNRIIDSVNIITKEIEENIINPYGEKRGKIQVKFTNATISYCKYCRYLSLFSFGFYSLLSGPYNRVDFTVELQVDILNKKNELLKRYFSVKQGQEIQALFRGYSLEDAKRK
ncbi:MAG: hypothetical protein PHI50_05055, partial [Alphaproteobacteria bacterium]|nr:hypothetical protein [Alphaproteobacteria bacterium]